MSAALSAAISLRKNKTFLYLFSAQVISLAGSGVTTVGLALFAYQLVGGASAAAVIGNALMLRILAFLLFSQLAGILADRIDRKRILVAADLVRFGLLVLFPFIDGVWQVYLLIFAINAVTAFFTPTFEAALPEVAGSEHYVKALSLSRVALDVEAVAAPALAGLIVATIGLRWLFWFDAITYLVSAALVVLSGYRSTPTAAGLLSLQNFISEIGHGTRILLREISLRRALLLSFVEATAGAIAIVSTVVYVRDVLLLGDTTFALLMAGLGLGSTATALLLSRVTGRYESHSPGRSDVHMKRHRWAELSLVTGSTILGLLLLPGILQPSVIWFALLWTMNGAGQVLIAIPSSTLLAEHTTEAERGRAYAAYFALTHAFWLITYPVVGHATAAFGAPLTFTMGGMVCLLITLIVFVSTRTPVVPHRHA